MPGAIEKTNAHEPAPAAPPATGVRTVAWCGWWLDLPDSFRPTRIEGDTRRGSVHLSEPDRMRLVLRWATVARRPAHAERLVRRQLLRGMRRSEAKQLRANIALVRNPRFESIVCVDSPDGEVMRCVGYSAASNRMVELLYHRANLRQDHWFKQNTLAQLTDQAPNEPQRWSIFDLRFIAPAGMRYESSTLNIGDMRVRVVGRSRRRWWRAAVVVRQVYPAELALKRQPLEKWMDQWIARHHREYRLPRAVRRRQQKYDPLETPIGIGLCCRAHLRRALRAIHWRIAGEQCYWLIHDEHTNRLIMFEATDHRDELDLLMQDLVKGLHWQIEGPVPPR